MKTLSNALGSGNQHLDITEAVGLHAGPVEQIVVSEFRDAQSHLLAGFMNVETNCVCNVPEQSVPCKVHIGSPISVIWIGYTMEDLKLGSKSSGHNVVSRGCGRRRHLFRDHCLRDMDEKEGRNTYWWDQGRSPLRVRKETDSISKMILYERRQPWGGFVRLRSVGGYWRCCLDNVWWQWVKGKLAGCEIGDQLIYVDQRVCVKVVYRMQSGSLDMDKVTGRPEEECDKLTG